MLLLLAAFFAGVLCMRGDAAANPTPATVGPAGARAPVPIDPDDAHQLRLLLNLTGGRVSDPAAARAALTRFRDAHGRPATTADVSALLSLMR